MNKIKDKSKESIKTGRTLNNETARYARPKDYTTIQ